MFLPFPEKIAWIGIIARAFILSLQSLYMVAAIDNIRCHTWIRPFNNPFCKAFLLLFERNMAPLQSHVRTRFFGPIRRKCVTQKMPEKRQNHAGNSVCFLRRFLLFDKVSVIIIMSSYEQTFSLSARRPKGEDTAWMI